MSLAALGQLAALAQNTDWRSLAPRCAPCVVGLADSHPLTLANPAASVFEGSLLCRDHLAAAVALRAVERAHTATHTQESPRV